MLILSEHEGRLLPKGLHVLLPPRDFSMKGAWAGSRIFLLYVLVTRSTSGCFRVISSINVW